MTQSVRGIDWSSHTIQITTNLKHIICPVDLLQKHCLPSPNSRLHIYPMGLEFFLHAYKVLSDLLLIIFCLPVRCLTCTSQGRVSVEGVQPFPLWCATWPCRAVGLRPCRSVGAHEITSCLWKWVYTVMRHVAVLSCRPPSLQVRSFPQNK